MTDEKRQPCSWPPLGRFGATAVGKQHALHFCLFHVASEPSAAEKSAEYPTWAAREPLVSRDTAFAEGPFIPACFHVCVYCPSILTCLRPAAVIVIHADKLGVPSLLSQPQNVLSVLSTSVSHMVEGTPSTRRSGQQLKWWDRVPTECLVKHIWSTPNKLMHCW